MYPSTNNKWRYTSHSSSNTPRETPLSRSSASKLRAIINGATHNALLGIQRALRIAVQLRLSDPQGFINPTTQATNSIQFIDIHYGSAVIAQQMLDIGQKDRVEGYGEEMSDEANEGKG
ncbi:hypothetical protein K435DRAFT_809974 [Dendrothele bispora CBS 962.96]|uniref:Uncharacterized protein n=1 Tax=Dendrothele bispora (strain CBS 962.96) TaxID=1314807 RepID=A0A4S8KWP9_DENBC|nr:hypothetical protein K435DRAFT_809974 [Dendrothele bispora CBS 962.96]